MQRHGRLYQPSVDGRIFHAQTAVTGVAPGTSLGTTAAFALHNPAGSGAKLAVQRAQLAYVSGTLGSGIVYHAMNPIPVSAVPSGTAIVPSPAKINGSEVSRAKPLTTATVVAPTPIRPFCTLSPMLATSVLGVFPVVEVVDGDIIVLEGTTYILHSVAAAGTSPLVVFGVTWEEIPDGVA
jgi:hypothetical protein